MPRQKEPGINIDVSDGCFFGCVLIILAAIALFGLVGMVCRYG